VWVPEPAWTGAKNLAPHRDSIPGPSSPYRVPIPNELSRPLRILAGYNLNSIVFRRTSGQSMGTVEQSNILCDIWEAGKRIERSHCVVYIYHEDTSKVVNLLFPQPTVTNTLSLHQFFLFLIFFFSSVFSSVLKELR
jgi:hypothetical protein